MTLIIVATGGVVGGVTWRGGRERWCSAEESGEGAVKKIVLLGVVQ